MIRFSHSANSWQVALNGDGWFNVAPDEARIYFDGGMKVWHEQRLIVI